MTDKKIFCPLMQGPCIEDGTIRDNELVACRFWIQVQGADPQTGQQISRGDCAIAWMPVLLIENSKVNRETGAAVESLRNESVTGSQQISGALMHLAGQAQQQVAAPSENFIEEKP